jgi:GGDEF domain-containing protein
MGERFRLTVLARAITHGGHPQSTFTVSIGAAACLPDRDGSSYQFLIESADKAPYAAKALGRN